MGRVWSGVTEKGCQPNSVLWCVLRVGRFGLGSGHARGDAAPVALEGLFDDHYERLVASLTLAAGSREVARDAVQDAFVAAHVRWRRLASYEDPVGWVRRAAVNRILNHHRAGARWRRAALRLRGHDDQADAQVVVDRVDVREALDRLSVRQRMAVILYYLEGMSVAEAATVMGVTAGSVKTHLSRARDVLRPLLEVSG